MTKLVSIIMPAYNAAPYIEEAIKSILNQSYSNWELLICNDGSSDETLKFIKKNQDERIKVFENKRNIGNLKTTNFLFSKCEGDFVAIQDADDYCEATKLAKQLQAFEEDKNLGMVGVNYELVDVNKVGIRCGYYPLVDKEIKEVCKTEAPPFVYAGVMVKKKVLNKIGDFRPFFNRMGGADYDWMYRIVERFPVKNLKEVLYFYRFNPKSFTKLANGNLLKSHTEDVALFLANQRSENGGEDALTRDQPQEIYRFLSELAVKVSTSKYWSKDKKCATQYARWAITLSPLDFSNWKHYFYILRK